MQDIEMIFGFFQKYSNIVYYILTPIIILLIILYYKCRAKSAFSITHRLLIFIIGKDKTNNEKGSLINDIIEIEKFNFYYKTNATSLKHKQEFEKWIRKYELDYRLLSKLKGEFDIETLSVRNVPGKRKLLSTIAGFIISFICFLALLPILINLSIGNYALLEFTDSRETYWISHDKARKFSYSDIFYTPSNQENEITAYHCEEGKIKFKIHPNNLETICSLFTSKEEQDFLDKKLREQHIFFRYLMFILTMALYIFINYLFNLANARDAYNMIKRKVK
ncbi:DUF6216 family protein [Actinobacillus equuli]|uniref:DUF6216 family protein n=1 Tax=Actinobacillus equuli TaxID=718 RepID=UPI00244291EA|nr:DUF6216 family protein [Actinobacillus equuli]WGE53659.1 DUF6216 family protein [Actinobacillus equuli subsp. haemolyticus]WGE74095.1 DUF6216 family protein [Actinobacillus equuli subsp. haemolyticus]